MRAHTRAAGFADYIHYEKDSSCAMRLMRYVCTRWTSFNSSIARISVLHEGLLQYFAGVDANIHSMLVQQGGWIHFVHDYEPMYKRTCTKFQTTTKPWRHDEYMIMHKFMMWIFKGFLRWKVLQHNHTTTHAQTQLRKATHTYKTHTYTPIF
jgi:hypothetical protein